MERKALRDLADRSRDLREPKQVGKRWFSARNVHSAAERLKKARRILDAYPTAIIENWRQLPDGQIEFTMRRLTAAD
jgi:hypothetical protein